MRPILTHSGGYKIWEDKYAEGVAEVVEFLTSLPAAVSERTSIEAKQME
jgi:hypothetical protein